MKRLLCLLLLICSRAAAGAWEAEQVMPDILIEGRVVNVVPYTRTDSSSSCSACPCPTGRYMNWSPD
jgi:hypothetical protein